MENNNKQEYKAKNKKALKRPPTRKDRPNSFWLWIGLIFLAMMLFSQTNMNNGVTASKELAYSEFYALVKDSQKAETVQSLTMTDNQLEGTLKDGSRFRVTIPADDKALLDLIRQNVSNFKVTIANTFWSSLIFSIGPILILIIFFWFLSNRGAQMGNRLWSFGKSRARINDDKNPKITFNDVAGVDEAKEELQEIIQFLKDPKKFERLGGKIPKGVLLIGRPGTGKTLLAKAVAGEADVPFFSLSGSDFVEMFVGVGASRVRDLFEQARKASKTSGKGCIIFIDEIDAVGRLRFSGIGGGHDEREQTLNALLVEMDGFDTHGGLIVMAATNRPDTLDPALLRPGRFDRQVVVPLPDIIGREEILKVHTRNIKLGPNVDLKRIAQQTVYFSGADLANACNEAALLAARKNKDFVEYEEMQAAIERVTMGPEKKSRIVSKREKEITAYHEAGHAILSLLVEGADPFTKVSIIPRGMAGGYTITPPLEDKQNWSRKELLAKIVIALGGRASEEIFLSDITTGAQSDLEQATGIARAMICEFGMSEKLGTLTLGNHHNQLFLGRDMVEQKNYSEATAKAIDDEIRFFIDDSYHRAKKLLDENREKVEIIVAKLKEKEILDVEEARILLGMPIAAEQRSASHTNPSA
ncbi:MAG TPA: ATP-dependent zinc metalloprotease FtsH [Candidatus Omnitrophota bacterium]|nr:ATP-dependent zinc metalloprotease FtsH [Candidatus Omnitrophota bacterium]HQL40794.1 ATP-dependent zinc metalloprotease FtsH [Candidatus Omnitrophota bacterium]